MSHPLESGISMQDFPNTLRYHSARLTAREGRLKPWQVYGDTMASYSLDFGPVIRPHTVPDLLGGKVDPVVIDLMAPSDPIAGMFSRIPDEGKLGIAVTRVDRRGENRKFRDKELGIVQISGDLLTNGPWKEIDEALGGRKADLIMERAWEGLDYVPVDRRLIDLSIRKLWNILSSDGGNLLLQTHPISELMPRGIDLESWQAILAESGIMMRYNHEKQYGLNVVRIIKNPDSPKELPRLS